MNCGRVRRPSRNGTRPTLSAVATSLGIPIRDGVVRAEGDLDFRGTLGVSKEVPVGFQQIRLRFELDTDANDDQLATLLKLTEPTASCIRRFGGRRRFRSPAPGPPRGRIGVPPAPRNVCLYGLASRLFSCSWWSPAPSPSARSRPSRA